MSLEQVHAFIGKLLEDSNLHVLVSWPADIELPDQNTRMDWEAQSLVGSTYISQADLRLYHHYTSNHGTTSCGHDIRTFSDAHGI